MVTKIKIYGEKMRVKVLGEAGKERKTGNAAALPVQKKN
jgi:hypothetical protein